MDSAICAAVLAPPTDDLFLAVRGEGATCNGESIKAPKADSVDRAIIGSGFPYYFEDPYKTNLPEWAAVTVKALAGRARELPHSIYATWLGAGSTPSGR
jgi:myo-inositol-1(or 4)-monophosphatase